MANELQSAGSENSLHSCTNFERGRHGYQHRESASRSCSVATNLTLPTQSNKSAIGTCTEVCDGGASVNS